MSTEYRIGFININQKILGLGVYYRKHSFDYY